MSQTITLRIFRAHVARRRVLVPYVRSLVSAGFPSPADDHLEGELDPLALLMRRPAATFFIRTGGVSMDGVRPAPARIRIHEGDILVVDRAEPARSGSVVVVSLGGEFVVKRLVVRGRRAFLQPEHELYDEIEITGNEEAVLWGVVMWKLTEVQRPSAQGGGEKWIPTR